MGRVDDFVSFKTIERIKSLLGMTMLEKALNSNEKFNI